MTLVLLCGTGFSVCTDSSGRSWICGPILSAMAGSSQDCQCPCEDDDCEEHEVTADYLSTDSLRAPERPTDTLGDSGSFSSFAMAAVWFEIPSLGDLHGLNWRRAGESFFPRPHWMHERLAGVVMVV